MAGPQVKHSKAICFLEDLLFLLNLNIYINNVLRLNPNQSWKDPGIAMSKI